MSRENIDRTYVAYCQFPNKRKFCLGTVVADYKAKDHELKPLFEELWNEIIPYPAPEFISYVPGILIFKEDKDERRS